MQDMERTIPKMFCRAWKAKISFTGTKRTVAELIIHMRQKEQ
jgi:hypothetical protein